jgi:hypothetical protein
LNYLWSGAGTISDPGAANITVTGASTGNYSITVTNSCGTTSQMISVVVNSAPAITCPAPQEYCINDPVIELVGGTPSGGVYSGSGIDGTTFTPAYAGVGDHLISYSYTDGNGCMAICNFMFVVNPQPAAPSTGTYGPLCSNDAPIALVGSPTGGSWSGTGVSGNTFDPSFGTQTLIYTITSDGCSNSTATTIEVNPQPAAPSTGTYGPLCSNDSPIALGGSPTGGTWSGTGVTGDTFDPFFGTQILIYTITSNGCSNSASTTITVNPQPSAPSTGTYGPLCSNDAPIALVGSPTGGTWSGTGVSGNTFDPSFGTQTLIYTITSDGCSNSTATTIEVNPQPAAPSTGTYGPLCSNDSPIALGGSPTGGTWSGTGVTGDTFDPFFGTQILTYTITSNGCSNSASTTITVNPQPSAPSTGTYGPLCSNDEPIALGGSPTGGTWSGTGTSGDTFDPSFGTQTLTYTITSNGCSNSASTEIVVNPQPAAPSTGTYGPLCSNDAQIALGGSPAGGTWSGTGVIGDTFDPSFGTQTITYSITSNGCSNSASTTIEVNPQPAAPSTGSYGPRCSNDAPIALTGIPSGGTWSGTGVTGDTFDPSFGTQTLTYTITSEGCSNSASTTIEVNPQPAAPSTGTYGPLCSNDAPIALTGIPSGGTWSGTGVIGETFDPAFGTQTITYTITSDGCSNSASTTIEVNPQPAAPSTGTYGPLCSNDAPIALTGIPSGGTWSGTGVIGETFDPAFGTQTITYTITSDGCSNSASTEVVVNAQPAAPSTGSYGPLCSNDEPIALGGSPTGGTWSGTGVSGDTFDPSFGTQTLTYTITSDGCSNSASTTIEVNPQPSAPSTGTYGPLCSNDEPIALGGSPTGGTWSGTGVSGDTFDPSFGTQTLTYTITSDGCSNSASTEVVVGSCDCAGMVNGSASIDQCGICSGGTTGITPNSGCVRIDAKAFLDGAYVTATGLMRDDLRANSHIPLLQPYGAAPWNHSENAATTQTILSITGNNAIVDWVLLELRSDVSPATTIARKAALVDRSGNIVDVDGSSPVIFNVAAGMYHVSIRHRNHLGIMTGGAVALDGTATTIDLRSPSSATYGLNARRTQGSVMTMWAGNVNGNSVVSYSGSNNDRTALLNTLGAASFLTPAIGYHNADITMNGVVNYSGSNNDRTAILNTLGAGTFLTPIVQQLP